jgi:hypothetical protein
MTLNRDAEASPTTPVCGLCQVPMKFVFTIPRVTEPGRVQMFPVRAVREDNFATGELGRSIVGQVVKGSSVRASCSPAGISPRTSR